MIDDERKWLKLHLTEGDLIVKLRADLAAANYRADAAEVALRCEATRHEETRTVVREYLAADAHRDAMVAAWLEAGEHDTDVNASLAAARTRYAEARPLSRCLSGTR